MEKRSMKAGVSSRASVPQDFEGTLDTMFIDEKGFKVAHVLNAKDGIVIGQYDKENALTEVFYPVDLLLNALPVPPKRSHHKKVAAE